jgi:hypothetical protein
MATPSVKPVLLSRDQIEQLRACRSRSEKSPLGLAPTIHVIARQLMDRAPEYAEGGVMEQLTRLADTIAETYVRELERVTGGNTVEYNGVSGR